MSLLEREDSMGTVDTSSFRKFLVLLRIGGHLLGNILDDSLHQ